MSFVMAAIVLPTRCGYVVETFGPERTRIQLCGRFVVELGGRRLEQDLPGRQGRLLVGYLAANRATPVRRDVLLDVLWPQGAPAAPEAVLRSLISKLRRVLGEERIEGRSTLRLVLPAGSRIDVETAITYADEAESAIALGRFEKAWLPARIALSVTRREFMADYEGDWIERRRRELAEVRLSALECIARIGLRLGPTELPAAERAARSLIELAPYRESGYQFLMETLEARSNLGEALVAYDRLRCVLRDELGTVPGREIQAVHERLLRKA
jgi:SARP family transcriptional regulator, regulator of embCAB operon